MSTTTTTTPSAIAPKIRSWLTRSITRRQKGGSMTLAAIAERDRTGAKTALRVKFDATIPTATWVFQGTNRRGVPQHLITLGDPVSHKFADPSISAAKLNQAMRALAAHEACHARYTERDHALMERTFNGIPFQLLNLAEDARIEYLGRHDAYHALDHDHLMTSAVNGPKSPNFGWATWVRHGLPQDPVSYLSFLINCEVEPEADGRFIIAARSAASKQCRDGMRSMQRATSVRIAIRVQEYLHRMQRASTTLELEPILREWMHEFKSGETKFPIPRWVPTNGAPGTPDSATTGGSGPAPGGGMGPGEGPGGDVTASETPPPMEGFPDMPVTAGAIEQERDLQQRGFLMAPSHRNHWRNEWKPALNRKARGIIRQLADLANGLPSRRALSGPRIDVQAVARRLPQRFVQQNPGGIPLIHVVWDCSASMSGPHMQLGGREVLAAIVSAHKERRIRFRLTLSSKSRGVVDVDVDRLTPDAIERLLPCDGGEGLARAFKQRHAVFAEADGVIVVTDGQLTDGHIDGALWRGRGLNIMAIAAGPTPDHKERFQNALRHHFGTGVVRDNLVDALAEAIRLATK